MTRNDWLIASIAACLCACGGTSKPLGPRDEEPPAKDEAVVYAMAGAGIGEEGPTRLKAKTRDEPLIAADAFAEAEAIFQSIDAIGAPTQSELTAWTRARTSATAEAVAAYAIVLGAGEPEWAVAAYVRMGECYRDLGRDLAAMPAPEGLTEEQAEVYRETIKSYRDPMVKAAREQWLAARAMADREGLQTTWSRRAEALLAGSE